MSQFQVSTLYAFADGLLKGNPAGVCVLPSFPDEKFMRAVAYKMGYSETAFAVKQGDNTYALRWFSPYQEVPLCGHATLATAAHLHACNAIDASQPIRFDTAAGTLDVTQQEDGWRLRLQPAPAEPCDGEGLSECIDAPIEQAYYNGTNYVAVLADLATLKACKPQLETIKALPADDLIITTATDTEGYDFAYRCFSPQLGINEDPVTGSAQAVLAPLWAEKLGQTEFRALQASAEGGALHVRLHEPGIDVSGKVREGDTCTVSTLIAPQTHQGGHA